MAVKIEYAVKCYLVLALLAACGLPFIVTLSPGDTIETLYVSQDGTGDFQTIQAAVDSVKRSDKWTRIRIAPGVYEGLIRVPASKQKLLIEGAGRMETILESSSSKIRKKTPHSKPFLLADDTMIIAGNDIILAHLSIRNRASENDQSLKVRYDKALVLAGDRIILHKVSLHGVHDTFVARSERGGHRFYISNSWIEGQEHFIAVLWDSGLIENTEIRSIDAWNSGQATAVYKQDKRDKAKSVLIISNSKFTVRPQDKKRLKVRVLQVSVNSSIYLLDSFFEEGVRWGTFLRLMVEAANRTSTVYLHENQGLPRFDIPGLLSPDGSPMAMELSDEEMRQHDIEAFIRGNDNWNPRKILEDTLTSSDFSTA